MGLQYEPQWCDLLPHPWRDSDKEGGLLKAEIFSIGTELLMGELTDTNAAWIAGRLPALGIRLQWVSIIGVSIGALGGTRTPDPRLRRPLLYPD